MAVGALREVRRGRILIGANDGGVYAVLPLVSAFQQAHPAIVNDVRRIAARQMAQEVLLRSVDIGVLTFNPPERELQSVVIGVDELVLLVRPDRTIYYLSVQSMPFVRPNFGEMVQALDFIIKNDYPARGEYVGAV